MDKLWINKYHPVNLKDVYGNKQNINKFEIMISEKQIFNMIINGFSGVGKKTLVQHLLKSVYENIDDGIIEFNYYNIKGISIFKEQIEQFVKKKTLINPKIIIINEFDNIANNIQHLLREIMDIYEDTVKVILICNTTLNIIEPIKSRCVNVNIGKLNDIDIYNNLKKIIENESCECTEESLNTIVNIANGNMRTAINNLQMVQVGFENITLDNIFKIINIPHHNVIKRILIDCYNKDIKKAINNNMKLYNDGYNVTDIIKTLFNIIKNINEIPEGTKYIFAKHISVYYVRIISGVDTIVQLNGLLAILCSVK